MNILLAAMNEVLSAMITPAVLISASGSLILSTSNLLSRVVDRVRVLLAEVEQMPTNDPKESIQRRQKLITSQLDRLAKRALLLRTAMTFLYGATGFLIATSIGIGLNTLVHWQSELVPIISGLIGTGFLLYASLLLVQEARLAVTTTLEEMEYTKEVILRRTLTVEAKSELDVRSS